MQLVLRCDRGETLKLDVLPEDTFNDLAERLYRRAKISVDFKQLQTVDRPFHMDANVIDYITSNRKVKENDIQSDPGYGDEINSMELTDHSKINNEVEYYEASSSKQNDDSMCVLQNEDSVQNINFDCNINKSEIPVADETLFDDFRDDHSVSIGEHIEEHKTEIDKKVADAPLCRLCAEVIDLQCSTFIFAEQSDSMLTVADKINKCLPIKVSIKDHLPKQICQMCVENLEKTHSFVLSVMAAEEALESLLFLCNKENTECFDCPFCCDGNMIEVNDKSDMQITDIYSLSECNNSVKSESVTTQKDEDFIPECVIEDSSEFVTETLNDDWTNEEVDSKCVSEEASNDIDSNNMDTVEQIKQGDVSDNDFMEEIQEVKKKRVHRKRGRPRKHDGDDYTSDDDPEFLPKKRGRPKGSRSKTTSLTGSLEASCRLCSKQFSDNVEILSHALSIHYDKDSDLYPCPICVHTSPDEDELINHVNGHLDSKELTVHPCSICGLVFEVRDELYTHLLEEHVYKATLMYPCPLCPEGVNNSKDVVNHVVSAHTQLKEDGSWLCPCCSEGYVHKEEVACHFENKHLASASVQYSCALCVTSLPSEEELGRHMLDDHCPSSVVDKPLFYRCLACEAKFKTQYALIKHSCPGVVDSPLYCEACDIQFPIKARYVLHLQFHNENGSMVMRCDTCLSKFDEEDAFYDHIRFQHEPDEEVNCEICDKPFKNSMTLSIHLRKHQNIRHHKCEVCGKLFLNAQTLREHSVSHMEVKPFQCHICGQYLSRMSRLRLHVRTHSVEQSKVSMMCHQCQSCLQVFSSVDQALKHGKTDHMNEETVLINHINLDMVFRCEFCDGCFKEIDELNKHRDTVHQDKTSKNAFSCNVCGSKFSSYSRVTTHKLSHGINTESLTLPDDYDADSNENINGPSNFMVPQYFVCEICNKKYLHYTYLNMHRKLHAQANSKSIYSCKDCCEKFTTSWSLHYHRRKNHVKTIVKEEKQEFRSKDGYIVSLECPICVRSYASEETLEAHMKRIHGRTSSGSGFVCEACGKIFAFKGAWQAHCDAHNGVKRFPCKECDKRFTHKAGLKKHMKLHSNDQPFLCDYCGKKFRDRTERENHVRAHTGERPYMCDVCGRTFYTRAVWLDHSRIHQNVRPHTCNVCGQKFRRSFALKSHYLIHTGERPHNCKICGKDFRLKQTLTAHIKKEHVKVSDINYEDDPSKITKSKVIILEPCVGDTSGDSELSNSVPVIQTFQLKSPGLLSSVLNTPVLHTLNLEPEMLTDSVKTTEILTADSLINSPIKLPKLDGHALTRESSIITSFQSPKLKSSTLNTPNSSPVALTK